MQWTTTKPRQENDNTDSDNVTQSDQAWPTWAP